MAKEIILNKNEENTIVTKYGSYNNGERPKVVYLRTKAKITPSKDKDTFETDINSVKEKFISFIDSEVNKNKFLDKNYIANIDISAKSVKYGKVSFLRYDVYLKPLLNKTLEENVKLFNKISTKINKKLINLLNKNNIKCL